MGAFFGAGFAFATIFFDGFDGFDGFDSFDGFAFVFPTRET